MPRLISRHGCYRLALVLLVLYWLALTSGTHWPGLQVGQTPGLREMGLEQLPIRLDKLLHFLAFGGLCGLLWLAWPRRLGRARPWRRWAGAVISALAYGGIDEWTQGAIAALRRPFSWGDLLANTLGVATVAMLLAAWTVWQGRRRGRAAGVVENSDVRGTSDDPAEAAEGGFVGHALLVSAMTFLSRITGLVRDAVLAAFLGLSGASDAFSIAFLVPNLFRRLFGEGALSAAFIPLYSRFLKEDPLLARRFASACLALLVVSLAALTLMGEVALWALGRFGEFSERGRLAIELAQIMLPYMPMVCVLALVGGILQVHRRFGPPAAAPVLLNLGMIAAAILGAALVAPGWSLRDPAIYESAGSAVVTRSVAGGVLVAGVLQLLWQGAVLWRCAPLGWDVAGVGAPLRRLLTVMLPMVLGLAVFQINAFSDSLIAMLGSAAEEGPETFTVFGQAIRYPIETGGVAALAWAQRLYQFPLGVFGIAIATAIFPALAAAAYAGPEARRSYADILRQGLRLTVFIGLPASVGMILVAVPLSRVVFERGALTTADAVRVAWILTGYAASIWAYAMTHVLTRAFYAREDARTPLRISLVMVGLNLAMNVVLIWPLGEAGLAWSTSLAAALQVAWLLRVVRKHTGGQPVLTPDVWYGWGRTAAGCVAMAAVLGPVVACVDLAGASRGAVALWLAAMVIAGAGVMLVTSRLLRQEELAWLLRRRI